MAGSKSKAQAKGTSTIKTPTSARVGPKSVKLPTYDKLGDTVAKEVNERKRGIKT